MYIPCSCDLDGVGRWWDCHNPYRGFLWVEIFGEGIMALHIDVAKIVPLFMETMEVLGDRTS